MDEHELTEDSFTTEELTQLAQELLEPYLMIQTAQAKNRATKATIL